MPYYGAGDYYTAGDHIYGRGDFLGLGKAFKAVTGVVGKLGIPGISQAASILNRVAGGGTSSPGIPQIAPPAMPVTPVPGVGGAISRLLPGGDTGYEVVMSDTRPGRRPGDTGRIGHFKKDGTWTNRARPRMNAGNMKALRRANRRAHSFLRAYRTAVSYYVAKAPKGKAYVHFKKKT